MGKRTKSAGDQVIFFPTVSIHPPDYPSSIHQTFPTIIHLSDYLSIHSSVHPSNCPSIFPSDIHPSIHLTIYLTIYLSSIHPCTYLTSYPSIHPSIHPSDYISDYLSIIHPTFQLSIIHMSIPPFIYLSDYLSNHLTIHPSTHAPIYLSIKNATTIHFSEYTFFSLLQYWNAPLQNTVFQTHVYISLLDDFPKECQRKLEQWRPINYNDSWTTPCFCFPKPKTNLGHKHSV